MIVSPNPVLLVLDPIRLDRLVAQARTRLLNHLARKEGLMDEDQEALEAGVDAHLKRLVLSVLGAKPR